MFIRLTELAKPAVVFGLPFRSIFFIKLLWRYRGGGGGENGIVQTAFSTLEW